MVNTTVARTSWLFPLLLALVFVGVLSVRFVRHPAAPARTTGSDDRHSVGEDVVFLSIDFGDGKISRPKALPWRDGMTVEQLLSDAGRKNPEFSYQQQGSGSNAFLTQIGGVGGQSGERRYWQYWVNDERADRSFGAYELRPGDRILWRFAAEE